MKLPKFLSMLGIITVFSLFYVWQQSEVFRLAYAGQKKVTTFEDLLDKNAVLRYNIGKRASLVRIGEKVSRSADFQMPDTYRLVRLAYKVDKSRLTAQVSKKENLIARFFSIKRQAEAKTISISNPVNANAGHRTISLRSNSELADGRGLISNP